MLGAVVSAAFPDEPVTSPPRESRFGALLRNPQLSTALLALLIGFASVFSALVAWRASLASIDASRYQSLAVQQQARREQIERDLESTVQQDLRFVAEYQEDELAARELQTQADAVRSTDATAADALDLEAQSRMAMGRALKPFFLGAGLITLNDDGTVEYDSAYVLRNLSETNPELRELRTSNVANLANHANAKSINLVAVAGLVVAALFFLTIAQVSRGRIRLRQAFFVAGGLMVLVGAIGFIFVEVIA
jgi:hypothetical protein